jgi:hypothetical protein
MRRLENMAAEVRHMHRGKLGEPFVSGRSLGVYRHVEWNEHGERKLLAPGWA